MLTFCNGMGTSEDEKGVAPAENETLGLLFVLLRTIVVFELDAPNDVINEPEKKRESQNCESMSATFSDLVHSVVEAADRLM